jgi:hypothetical protein
VTGTLRALCGKFQPDREGHERIIVLLLTTVFAALFAYTALAADGKTVSYKSGDETVQAVLYTPAGKGPFPAIIVIHEWWA